MKKIKQNETVEPDEGGAAVLLLAGLGLGLWAWVRSRRAQAQALATRRFSQMRKLNPSPSPARMTQGKQLSQIWEPEHSRHWPWAF